MPAQIDCLIRYIRRIASPATSDTDAALLNRFLTNRDSEAFAALVRRHGSLILCVCRRLLSDSHDAEDAFQATFLVLARKASSVRPASALAAWLHGVAYRIALRLRGARARRRQREVPISELALPGRFSDPLAELSTRETLCILHEEVQRLPQVYRLPVILCCLEGLSQEEAARRLGWTAGTVKGRLERGRKQLHERLVKRGLTLMAALAAAEIARGTVTAGLVHAARSHHDPIGRALPVQVWGFHRPLAPGRALGRRGFESGDGCEAQGGGRPGVDFEHPDGGGGPGGLSGAGRKASRHEGSGEARKAPSLTAGHRRGVERARKVRPGHGIARGR